MKRIAIIGAGLSGLVLARQLVSNADVTVFEKSRGIGGRMSTRYAEPFYFDHGAQCFTARARGFEGFLKPYMDAGTVVEWTGKVVTLEPGKKETKRLWFEKHLVASPNMNSLCKALAAGLNIQTSCEILPLEQNESKKWILTSKEGKELGAFDWVISTAPPAQTTQLFERYLEPENPIEAAAMQGCYALMLGFNRPWNRHWIAAKVRENPIKWISVNSSKPGRNPAVTCLVAHSRNDWAEQHIDDDVNDAQAFLLNQLALVTGIDTHSADYVATHRWRYAIVENAQKQGCYVHQTLGLAATGDWCETSRIEEAWFHANQLTARITHLLHEI